MDETDIKILEELTRNGNMTTTELATRLYPKRPKKNRIKNLRRLDNFLRYRLKRLRKSKAVRSEERNGVAFWSISPNIQYGKMHIEAGKFKYEGSALAVVSNDVDYIILLG